jgi:hypothetical protein
MPMRSFDAGRTTNSSNLERPMNLYFHKPNRIELMPRLKFTKSRLGHKNCEKLISNKWPKNMPRNRTHQ